MSVRVTVTMKMMRDEYV